NRGKIVLTDLYPKIGQKDYFLFQVKRNSSRLGKILMEMNAKNSGVPKISKLWLLDNMLTDEQILTPVFIDFKWHNLNGKIVKGETQLETLMLSGKIRNAGEVRDLYVHLNDKKVFYKANLIQQYNYRDQIENSQLFQFKKIINLSPGINKISVFARSRNGFTSEHQLRILREY
ncbi:hypothetical protein OAJ61_00950, partial [bacterium]|nr:hypothetical protein [bacterium]